MKNLLNLKGAQLLSKQQQQSINGGDFLGCENVSGCYSLFWESEGRCAVLFQPWGILCNIWYCTRKSMLLLVVIEIRERIFLSLI